jgi:beta-glucosidase
MKSFMKSILALLLSVVMAFGAITTVFAYEAPADPVTGRPAARAMAKLVAEEGMVLMKNNASGGSGAKALPIANGESIAVFGINQIDFVHGGGGSGNFTSERYISLWQGLLAKELAGRLTLYKGLNNAYQTYYDNAWRTDISYAYGTRQGAVILRSGEMALTADQVGAAAAAADTALITIGRAAGEDADRTNNQGDFRLSNNEVSMINQVKARKAAGEFNKIIVVLNVTGVIETNWFKNDDAIDAVLMVYLPGMEGGYAMADVLCGDRYPSGKLVDTWAATYADYPSSANFGNSSYARYEEDIFVGYRYFETIPGAAARVNYEFGYGMSYADFAISGVNVSVTGAGREREVSVTATVTNNSGTYSGKEVVQVYYGAPENQLTQPKKELAAFVKTKDLAPGDSDTVTMDFAFDDMASYDDVGKTGNEAAYVLEAGEYKFYVGNSVKNVMHAGTFSLDALEVVQQLAHRMVPNTNNITRRLTSAGTYEALTPTIAAPKIPEEAEARYADPPQSDDAFITFKEVIEQYETNPDILTTFVSRMTIEELAYMAGAVTPRSSWHRTGIGGIDVYGIPKIGTANGPAGIQYNGASATNPERNTTFFPCATMQASTWNYELIELLGETMAAEARHFGMSLWQAPGMNLHRDPLCGRNFEYFSEDPLLTGKIGAAVTNGVQSQKFASQPKHFALNNQENGRWGNDTRVSERALREIYLKGYEITVKEAGPWSIMSSYNRINGTYASANYDLLTEILRHEWGWDGFVMTDFRTTPSHLAEILEGGDLKAPADSPNPQSLVAAVAAGSLQRWQLERSTERILKFILKTEDAVAVANNPFTYNVSLAVNSDSALVDNPGRRVFLADTLTWGAFKACIDNKYNQTYKLTSASNVEIADDGTVIAVGMRLVVTAEDGVTSETYAFSNASISLNKPAKASYSESASMTPNFAVDGSMSSRWSAYNANESNKWGHWIEIDLGDTYYISQILTSWYNGSSRTHNYDIWVKATEDGNWGDTSKNRNFSAQGYTRIIQSSANRIATKTDTIPAGTLARHIVVVGTGGSNGALTATLYEMEVFGWRLASEAYAIDEAAKTIAIPFNETTTAAASKLRIRGAATLQFGGQSTWIQNGDIVTVTDNLNRTTEYTVVSTPFLTHPAASTVLMEGEKGTLSVEIADEGLSCQWYVSEMSSGAGGVPIDGAAGTEFVIPSETRGRYYYYCVVGGLSSKVASVEIINDLALKKPVKASFVEGSNFASNANDGDDTTRWSAYNSGDRANHWIEFDLGDVYNIEQLTLMPYLGPSRTYNYEIWVKADADAQWSAKNEDNTRQFSSQGYTMAVSGTTPSAVRSDVVLPNAVPARYVAVRVLGGTGSTTLSATFHTINIYGWKLKSEYGVDETYKTIALPAGVSNDALLEKSYAIGNGRLKLSATGNVLTVLDEKDEAKAVYKIRSIDIYLNGSDVVAECLAYNGSGETRNVLFVLAEYDGDGRLIRIISDPFDIDPGTMSNGKLVIEGYNSVSIYKAFLWDGLTYAPIVEAERMN